MYTTCNFCDLRDIRLQAKKENQKVTVLADAIWGMGGLNVYVHPKDVNVAKLEGGEDGERAKYRVSWMKEIPSNCEC